MVSLVCLYVYIPFFIYIYSLVVVDSLLMSPWPFAMNKMYRNMLKWALV